MSLDVHLSYYNDGTGVPLIMNNHHIAEIAVQHRHETGHRMIWVRRDGVVCGTCGWEYRIERTTVKNCESCLHAKVMPGGMSYRCEVRGFMPKLRADNPRAVRRLCNKDGSLRVEVVREKWCKKYRSMD